MLVILAIILSYVVTYGSIVFAGVAALYWLVKRRIVLGLVLASFVAWMAYDLYQLLQLDFARQVQGYVWLGLRGWIGVVVAVALGGVGEYVRDRVGRRPVN